MNHPFDEALRLQAAGSDQPHTSTGTTSPAYWNMVGPFGGTTAATAMQAVMQHPGRLGRVHDVGPHRRGGKRGGRHEGRAGQPAKREGHRHREHSI